MSRYRLLPTPAQEAVLRDHGAHARTRENLAVEQHSHWHPDRAGGPGYLEQCRQLTAARAGHRDPESKESQSRFRCRACGLTVNAGSTEPLPGVTYGCLNADSWGSVPFARMPNISLEPGAQDASLDELVAGVEKGILIYGDGSWSIDQQRYNFQFGGQTFWEISKGKIAGMMRDVAYQSRTTDFWGACDGVGGRSTYELHGAFNDGKGEPGQVGVVSHGCPVARFRQVNVLNTSVSMT